jgi:hypothetical protein
MSEVNTTESWTMPDTSGQVRVPEALMEQFRPLLEKHDVPEQCHEQMVLFVEEQLADDDPFIAVVDGDERLLGFVEDVLARENEVLGEALHDLLDEAADDDRNISDDSTWRA